MKAINRELKFDSLNCCTMMLSPHITTSLHTETSKIFLSHHLCKFSLHAHKTISYDCLYSDWILIYLLVWSRVVSCHYIKKIHGRYIVTNLAREQQWQAGSS
jgi:hypothetical protein